MDLKKSIEHFLKANPATHSWIYSANDHLPAHADATVDVPLIRVMNGETECLLVLSSREIYASEQVQKRQLGKGPPTFITGGTFILWGDLVAQVCQQLLVQRLEELMITQKLETVPESWRIEFAHLWHRDQLASSFT